MEEVLNKLSELHSRWYASYAFKSCILGNDEVQNDLFIEFVNYCKHHKEEAYEFIENRLENRPSIIWNALPYMYFDDEESIEHYFDAVQNVHLNDVCNAWLNILKDTTGVLYYDEYDNYTDYVAQNYIGWDPRVEDDPNMSYKEYRERKKKIFE